MVQARPHYERIAEAQGGERCAICGRPPAKRKLDIDHCHKKLVIRGLLCHRCNRTLTHWVTPEWLREAALYLEREPFDLTT